MVIFNEKEMSSPYVRENKIIEINSTEKDFGEFIKKVEAGEDVSKIANIHVIRFLPYEGYKEEMPFYPLLPGSCKETERITGSYSAVHSQATVDNLRADEAAYHRPVLFEEYEKTLFEQTSNYVFKPEEFSLPKEEFLAELYSAAGILPTLWNEDLTLEEKRKLSADGTKLMRLYPNQMIGVISRDNPIPQRARIEFYQNLSDYEKRIINSGRLHPKFLTDIAIKLRMEPTEKDPKKMSGFLLTSEVLNKILEIADYNDALTVEYQRATSEDQKKEIASRYKNYYTLNDIVEETKNGFANKHPETIRRAKEAFEKEFHGRSPLVLTWYMEGQCRFRGIDPEKMTDEELDSIVKNFHQPNVKRIANYRNATLFALDGIMNFGNTKDQLIEYIGVQITPEKAKELQSKGFFTWLAKYNDITIALLDKILRYENNIQNFDLETDPKTTFSKAKNQRGYRDSKLYENKYHYKFEDNEIAIKGRHTVVKKGNLTMRFVDPDDYANYTIGYDTQCCQHWGNAGESCVWKYTTDPFAAGVVIEENGEVAAQAFVFTNEENSTFVFDNIEFSTKLDRNADANAHTKFMGIIDTFANALPYKNVHIGMGYNALGNGIGDKLNKEEYVPMPTTIKDGHVYSDYHINNARVIKRAGRLAGREEIDSTAKVEKAPDEPTRWDELASPNFAYMLNNCQISIEERIQMAREFLENPSEEAQMKMVRTYPQAVLALDNPCHEAQIYLLNNPATKDKIDQIKNPCMEVQVELFNRDPGYLRKATLLPEEFKLRAVQTNGLLLEVIPEPNDEIIKAALKQNGYSIRYLPKEQWTDEYMQLAVATSPKVITLFDSYSDDVIKSAVEKDPDIFSLAKGGSAEIRHFALEQKPSIILHMQEPTEEEVRFAVEQNGLLIRNFQNQYPELREVAIRQNPWAIGAIHSPSFEEATLAISLNPAVAIRIKDPQLMDEIRLAMDLNGSTQINTDIQDSTGIEL